MTVRRSAQQAGAEASFCLYAGEDHMGEGERLDMGDGMAPFLWSERWDDNGGILSTYWETENDGSYDSCQRTITIKRTTVGRAA